MSALMDMEDPMIDLQTTYEALGAFSNAWIESDDGRGIGMILLMVSNHLRRIHEDSRTKWETLRQELRDAPKLAS